MRDKGDTRQDLVIDMHCRVEDPTYVPTRRGSSETSMYVLLYLNLLFSGKVRHELPLVLSPAVSQTSPSPGVNGSEDK